MSSNNMSAFEWRAITSLSSIMILRMVGLFMVLPVFALYSSQLQNATPFLIGVALGIYGLFQALLQIPLGFLSDIFGRKPIIFFGLSIFILGSLIAGFAHSMHWMILGRSLQGMGAIGGTLLASISDLTRETQRTKSMAIAGIAIGFSFSFAMLLGPVLTKWLSVSTLFYLAALYGFLGIIILFYSVPSFPSRPIKLTQTRSLRQLLVNPALLKLNMGIFILHALFTASFMVIPTSLQKLAGIDLNQQWQIYLPALLTAFIFCAFIIQGAERKQKVKFYFLLSISCLILAELFFYQLNPSYFAYVCSISLFFLGFFVLEAFLPSMVSRTAPPESKGSAMGIYSCAQFSGIFVGGVVGGWLYGHFGVPSVYLFCVFLALFWLTLSVTFKSSYLLTMRSFQLLPSAHNNWEELTKQLKDIPGIYEVNVIAEQGKAYLKMEPYASLDPNFIKLSAQVFKR